MNYAEDKGLIYAQTYARNKNGAIVVVSVHPKIELKRKMEWAYIYEIPDAKGGCEEYFQVEGIIPIAVLEPRGIE